MIEEFAKEPFDFASAYDGLNADDSDHRFYVNLADELGAHRVIDLGCGTGVLALLLGSRGHAVTAIDPDPDMLRVARAKPGADTVPGPHRARRLAAPSRVRGQCGPR